MNKIVIFDWGGVIENHKDPEYGWHALTRNIVNKLSGSNDKDVKSWGSYIDEGKRVSICAVNKKEDLYKWIDYVALENGFSNNKEEFFKVYDEEYSKIVYYKDVVEYLHSLKDRCLVGILSNLIMLDKERLDKQVDFNYIDKLFLSFELGMVKPNDDIYERVESILGFGGNNILFIDDREENIIGAQKRGWNTLLATGDELDLIKEKVEDFLSNK